MKRAIIFGATGGIGQAIARELAADGWSLYLHYFSQQAQALALSEELMQQYPKQDFMTLKLDFNSDDKTLKRIIDSLLPVNGVVFAHGITDFNFLGSQDLSTIETLIKINLTTPLKIVSLLEPMLLKVDHSRIVFLGSVYGGQASAMESVYSATKGALSSFAQGYGREVASSHLTVNVIAPGAVATKMNAIFSKETLEQVKDEIPAGRLAKPEDVSFWVKNLLAPQSDYLTGQTIYVDGGWLV
ncbi:3-oxoacyl-[acyl-carrier protein] reductase [Lactobacillus colini]|uniref:3-oxoacyl-[acyl-carrier protein] reductase n=1 Tax=Lactobacillus colini TaxID=1819254 RepID=A0ABS4MD84_9LACO|nr:SDR family oxidoreductase [Lactobacillus colini]MBP2057645.1 3-oxoacyl-[acyl-carrier protein] reductase [Lactobacillus colini]